MKKFLLLFALPLLLAACQKDDVSQQTTLTTTDPVRINYLKEVPKTDKVTTRGVLFHDKMWEAGDIVTVQFMNGTAEQQAQVKKYAADWIRYANVKFKYVTDGSAMVRIAFDWNGDRSTWNHIGTDHLNVPAGQPTLNFGNLQAPLSENAIKGIIMKQIGHVLGLGLEHQRTDNAIQWNKQAVYDYILSQPSNTLSKADIDKYYFEKYSTSATSNSETYDPKSIMHIEVPANFTLNNQGIAPNYTLSEQDIEFIREAYPGAYYNGYEHDLPEPNWMKLKTIKNTIGATRDMDGSFYFYPYASGDITKYKANLTGRTVLGTKTYRQYRNSARIIPSIGAGGILLRKGYSGSGDVQTSFDYLDLENPGPEKTYHRPMQTNAPGSVTYDYDRGLLYHLGRIYDNQLNLLGTFTPQDGSWEGIVYWGKKYKWAVDLRGMGDNPTFYVYEQSDIKDLFSKGNEIAVIPTTNFRMHNGAYTSVYEYNNKLVIVRYGGSQHQGLAPTYGSIIVLDPTNKGSYKMYEHKDAKWTDAAYPFYLCGGFWWKHKLMVYDENHSKYEFEIKELKD